MLSKILLILFISTIFSLSITSNSANASNDIIPSNIGIPSNTGPSLGPQIFKDDKTAFYTVTKNENMGRRKEEIVKMLTDYENQGKGKKFELSNVSETVQLKIKDQLYTWSLVSMGFKFFTKVNIQEQDKCATTIISNTTPDVEEISILEKESKIKNHKYNGEYLSSNPFFKLANVDITLTEVFDEKDKTKFLYTKVNYLGKFKKGDSSMAYWTPEYFLKSTLEKATNELFSALKPSTLK
ncbi:MAG: hypothetical protein HQK51_14195 [Oligoflexia bacterium]|nr:hypothetical protein [Oligoflexia bacterium]